MIITPPMSGSMTLRMSESFISAWPMIAVKGYLVSACARFNVVTFPSILFTREDLVFAGINLSLSLALLSPPLLGKLTLPIVPCRHVDLTLRSLGLWRLCRSGRHHRLSPGAEQTLVDRGRHLWSA